MQVKGNALLESTIDARSHGVQGGGACLQYGDCTACENQQQPGVLREA
jgi:hypothetical protein